MAASQKKKVQLAVKERGWGDLKKRVGVDAKRPGSE